MRFSTILVVMYVCLNVESPKKCMSFDTQICGCINIYIEHGNKQSYQEIEYGYIFVNVFVKLDHTFYITLLIRHTLMIDPNRKP